MMISVDRRHRAIRSLSTALLPLLLGCQILPAALGIKVKDDDARGSTIDSLSSQELSEKALGELMGVGNGEKISRPNPTEAEVHTPVMAHSYPDQVVLARRVFLPIVKDPTRSRELDKVLCEWTLREENVAWTKTRGGALDAQKCEHRRGNSILFWHPGLRLALAEMVLEGHPNRAALRNQLIEHIGRTWGGRIHSICYRTEDKPAVTPKVDAQCSGLWGDAWNGERNAMSVSAFFYEPVAPDQLRVRFMEDSIRVLDKVDTTAPGADRIQAYRAELEALLPERRARREAALAERRAKNPSVISAQEASHGASGYLWHRLCASLRPHREIDDGVVTYSDRICVSTAFETVSGCQENDIIYDRPEGSNRWHMLGGTGGHREVPCP